MDGGKTSNQTEQDHGATDAQLRADVKRRADAEYAKRGLIRDLLGVMHSAWTLTGGRRPIVLCTATDLGLAGHSMPPGAVETKRALGVTCERCLDVTKRLEGAQWQAFALRATADIVGGHGRLADILEALAAIVDVGGHPLDFGLPAHHFGSPEERVAECAAHLGDALASLVGEPALGELPDSQRARQAAHTRALAAMCRAKAHAAEAAPCV